MSPREGDLRRTSIRLGLQTGLLVVGVLAVVGVLIFVIYARAADEAADTTLREVTSNIDRPNEAPSGVHVVVVTPAGRKQSAGMPAGFPDEAALAAVRRDGRVREVDRTVHGREYTVRTVRVGNRVTQAVLDRHELVEERARILTSVLIAGGVGVLLAALVATWLARRAMQPLTDSLAMQRRFVADASHELRTPLTLLSTRLQLVARRARQRPGGLGADDLEGVLADTSRLTEVLDDLLIAADTRADADRVPLDLATLVRECVDAASGAAEERGVRLVLDAPGEVRVAGVAPALRRAVTALVDNALDHADDRVDVRVGTRSGHGHGHRRRRRARHRGGPAPPRLRALHERAARRRAVGPPALRHRARAGRRRGGRPRRVRVRGQPAGRLAGRGADARPARRTRLDAPAITAPR